METIGAPELLIILAVVLLLFGSKKIPEIARTLGESIKEFRRGVRDSGKGPHDGT